MNAHLLEHLSLCKLDKKRFGKLKRVIEVMTSTSKTADEMLIKFADRCYGKEKDRTLAKMQAKTFIDLLFGSADAVFKYGPEVAVHKLLEEQGRPKLKIPTGPVIKAEVIHRKKSENFISHLHEQKERDMEEHPMWTRKLNQYLVGPTLGVGGTAKVKLAYNPKTQTKVAFKILNPKYADSAEKEIAILKKLSHKNVVQVYDCFSNVLWNDTYTTVFAIEYACQGELIEYLMYTSKFEDDLARWFFVSLTEGVEYCHKQHIVHRDLKHDNCLLGDNFVLKITDFGFATHYTDELMKTALGTAQYAAPEILRGKKYTDAVDIFSMGVMLFIALAGSQPWKKASAKSDRWYKMVHSGNWKQFFKYHERSHKFTKEQRSIIRGVLEPNPDDRWTIAQIKRCSWFEGKKISESEVASRLKNRKIRVDDKKFKAMKAENSRSRRAIFSRRLPYTYFQPPSSLSFVTSQKAEWVLEEIVDVIKNLRGSIKNFDIEKYKVSFEVSKTIDTGSYKKKTKEKVLQKVRVCASVQMWTHPGQKDALQKREKILSAMTEQNVDMPEMGKSSIESLPAIKSIAVFRAEGGDQMKLLFPGIYSDILVRLPANVIYINEMGGIMK